MSVFPSINPFTHWLGSTQTFPLPSHGIFGASVVVVVVEPSSISSVVFRGASKKLIWYENLEF